MKSIGLTFRCFALSIVRIIGILSLVLGAQVDAVFAANWLHFGYDDQYTSYNPTECKINIDNIVELEKKWDLGCDGGYGIIARSPSIYNDTLYTTGSGSKLTAYNALTGVKLWEFGDGSSWQPQTVVSEDGIVFYMEGSYPTYLYAINGNNGDMLWKSPIGFEMGYSDENLVTVDEDKGAVYIIEYPFAVDGTLYAVDIHTGDILWYKNNVTDNIGFKGNYVLLNSGKIFTRINKEVDFFDKEFMVRIDTASHEVEVTYDRPESPSVEYHDILQYNLCLDRLIVSYDDYHQIGEMNTLAAYSTDSSSILWEKDFLALTGKIACNTDKKQIYVSSNSSLYALDADTGEEVWGYASMGPIYNPSIANGIVYFLSKTNMYALNENTGELVFSYPLGSISGENTQVAVNEGMLFFSSNGWTCSMYALGLPGSIMPGSMLHFMPAILSATLHQKGDGDR